MESTTNKDILIIGFGNQAKAWALNLRDSGWNVSIALRENSASREKVKTLGFSLKALNAKIEHSLIALLTPDHTHEVILKEFKTSFKKETHFILAHGYSLTYNNLRESFSHFTFSLLAPKAIASELRFRFESRDGLGAIYETEHQKIIKLIAHDLGINHLTQASARNETIADLFSEQTILCSLLPYGALESFNLLVANGIEEEVAYFECWFEIKLIVDTMIKMGPQKFFEMISPNALIGSEIGRSLFFDENFKKNLHDCFDNISLGHFHDDTKKIDIEKLKEDVKQFWKKEQLSHVHNTLKDKLYTRRSL